MEFFIVGEASKTSSMGRNVQQQRYKFNLNFLKIKINIFFQLLVKSTSNGTVKYWHPKEQKSMDVIRSTKIYYFLFPLKNYYLSLFVFRGLSSSISTSSTSLSLLLLFRLSCSISGVILMMFWQIPSPCLNTDFFYDKILKILSLKNKICSKKIF